MIRGKVHFDWGDGPLLAELTDAGWRVVGLSHLEALLNLRANPSDCGPADGDPAAKAVKIVAALLEGKAELPEIPDHPGRAY